MHAAKHGDLMLKRNIAQRSCQKDGAKRCCVRLNISPSSCLITIISLGRFSLLLAFWGTSHLLTSYSHLSLVYFKIMIVVYVNCNSTFMCVFALHVNLHLLAFKWVVADQCGKAFPSKSFYKMSVIDLLTCTLHANWLMHVNICLTCTLHANWVFHAFCFYEVFQIILPDCHDWPLELICELSGLDILS